ncbi:unnamed protein product [Sphenostylis stenocarpa]|uniref:RING-type domain-containing protein n=1 Tax=Sphenostylis stenocarpa TaxID=92480 RepID=A0AA86VRC2_9FABA|nr:unnamed protein product [Sphenostylis stenocarpa]
MRSKEQNIRSRSARRRPEISPPARMQFDERKVIYFFPAECGSNQAIQLLHSFTSTLSSKPNPFSHFQILSLMSAASPPPSAAATTTGVGLGYGIAIAVSILVLISSIMLASYACVRIKSNSRGTLNNTYYDQTEPNNTIRDSAGPRPMVLGLEKPVIEAYPKIVVGESGRLPRPDDRGLCEYLPKEAVRCVPSCHHCFHADSVDVWLRMSATCPLCRNSPSPSPAPTPLSEIVPLPFHAR